MNNPHYECASRSSRTIRTPEDLTEEEKRKVERLVESGGFDEAKKSQQLDIAECVHGYRHQHKIQLGKVKVNRSAPQPSVTKPVVTAPAVTTPANDEDIEQLRRRAIAAIV